MLLSVIEPRISMDSDNNLTQSLWHWLAPILSAVVSITALAALVFYTGSSAQRLTTAEDQIRRLDEATMKKSEVKYQLDTIEKNISEIKQDLKERRLK